MSKPIILALFCTCLVSTVALAANESQGPATAMEHGSSSVSVAKASIVDINQATVAEFEALHGLADSKAKAIVSYREAHGNFNAVSELVLVKGIGDKLLQKLEDENPGRLACATS